MKSIIFGFSAVFFYAIATILIEQKLAKFNTLTLMVGYLAVMLVVTIIARQTLVATTGGEATSFAFPTGSTLWVLALVGLLIFTADFFFVSSYTSGGSLLTLAAITALYPVIASILRMAWVWQLPNMYQIGGYVLAFFAVMLIVKGNALQ